MQTATSPGLRVTAAVALVSNYPCNPWLNAHGGYCDCEVIYNVYNAVVDLVEWHLDEDA